MTLSPIEQAILETENWLERLDRQRDAMMRAMSVTGVTEVGQQEMSRIERERVDVVALVDELHRLRHRVPLLLRIRPRGRTLKVPLRRPESVRKRA